MDILTFRLTSCPGLSNCLRIVDFSPLIGLGIETGPFKFGVFHDVQALLTCPGDKMDSNEDKRIYQGEYERYLGLLESDERYTEVRTNEDQEIYKGENE